MRVDNKFYSKTKGNAVLAQCYIEECINEPDNKMYKYYWFSKSERMYLSRTFIMNEGMLANHLMYNEPERLQQLLDECQLYRYIIRTVRKYEKAVEEQTEKLSQNDRQMYLAKLAGNMDMYYSLEKNNKYRAEEMLRPLLYGE